MKFVYPVLVLSSSISTLLPFLFSLTAFRHLYKYSKSLLYLGLFFTLASTTEITLYILNFQGKSSAWISHIYTLIEYSLITMILADWQTNSAFARLIRITSTVFILLFIVVKITGLENFSLDMNNFITRPLAVLLLSAFAFITLQDLWSRTPANLTNDYRFWMLLAMALYYSASLALFAFMFTKDQQVLIALFKIHAVVNILHNILFTIGVLRLRSLKQDALQPEVAS